jgi:serine/threonine-protein kinase
MRVRFDRLARARTAQLSLWHDETGEPSYAGFQRVSLPMRIGPYRVHAALGAGGMAETFIASRAGLGAAERVCVKRLLPGHAHRADVMEQFEREASLLSALEHPNIVRAHEFGQAESGAYLALELVVGVDLGQLIAQKASLRQRMKPEHCFYIVTALCGALAHAHALRLNGAHMGLVHRDLTPSNVLLSERGEVKLADFGIARTHGRSAHTQPGHAKGKSGYMAPEQITCAEIDARADLFALGVVLFQLLFGFMPFEGHSDYEVMRKIVNGERAEFPAQAALLPRRALDLCTRLLATDPENRPASAAEVLAELEALPTPCGIADELGAVVARARQDRLLSHGDVPTRLHHGASDALFTEIEA